MRRCQLLGFVLAATSFSLALAQTGLAQDGEIRLLVRVDDMGVAQAVNEACIQCARDGIVRSVEVIVPGPWLLDAVRLLKENPGLDVGVHASVMVELEGDRQRSPTGLGAKPTKRPFRRQIA